LTNMLTDVVEVSETEPKSNDILLEPANYDTIQGDWFASAFESSLHVLPSTEPSFYANVHKVVLEVNNDEVSADLSSSDIIDKPTLIEKSLPTQSERKLPTKKNWSKVYGKVLENELLVNKIKINKVMNKDEVESDNDMTQTSIVNDKNARMLAMMKELQVQVNSNLAATTLRQDVKDTVIVVPNEDSTSITNNIHIEETVVDELLVFKVKSVLGTMFTVDEMKGQELLSAFTPSVMDEDLVDAAASEIVKEEVLPTNDASPADDVNTVVSDDSDFVFDDNEAANILIFF
jgi:hypothetical protein